MFSPREEKIIKIIGDQSVTIEHLSKKLWKPDDRPMDADILVGNSIRRIVLKCTHHKLKWTLTKNRENKPLTIQKENV